MLVVFIVRGPLQFLISNSCIFWPQVFPDPIGCVYKAWYWPCVQMFSRPCPPTFILFFSFWDTNGETLSPCALKHVLWQHVFWVASEFKVRNLIQLRGHFAIYLCWLFGLCYISSLHSADVSQEGRMRYEVPCSSSFAKTSTCCGVETSMVSLTPRDIVTYYW